MRRVKIEGQAVFEGIMARNNGKYALAVRKPDNDIILEISKFKSFSGRHKFFRLPFVRGAVHFIESLYLAIKMFSHSSTFYEDEDINRDDNLRQILIVIATISLAVAMFLVLPYGLSMAFKNITSSDVALTVIEGFIRLILLLFYIFAISLVPDIKRMYMYNGAEHKAINCIEAGLPLTTSNVRRMSRLNIRSGTSFILDVVILSIILFMFIRFDDILIRLIFRIILVPVIAGLAYEFIRLADESENLFLIILSVPGLLLQQMTTKEPDDAMIEVAISALEAVFDSESFIKSKPVNARKNVRPVTRPVAGVGASSKLEKKSKPLHSDFKNISEAEPIIKQKREMLQDRARNSLKEDNNVLNEKDAVKKNKDVLKENTSSLKADDNSDLNDDILNALDHFFDEYNIKNDDGKNDL